MDIKTIVNGIVKKLKADPALLNKFKKNPVETLETMSGIDLPDGGVNAVVVAVKAKLGEGDIASTLGSIFKK